MIFGDFTILKPYSGEFQTFPDRGGASLFPVLLDILLVVNSRPELLPKGFFFESVFEMKS